MRAYLCTCVNARARVCVYLCVYTLGKDTLRALTRSDELEYTLIALDSGTDGRRDAELR